MIKLLGVFVLLAIVAGGGWYVTTKQDAMSGKLPAAEDILGSYAYECTNDVTMRMEPSSDLATVRVMIQGGTFPSEAILAKVATANARYENEVLTFTGAGEEVQIFTNEHSAVCMPVFSNDEAPFNWGDAGEGGGVVVDPVRIASEGIVGTWEMDDTALALEFSEGGALRERRDDEWMTGTWTMSAPADAPVVTLMFNENPHGSSCEVSTLTPEKLVLSCTGEGEKYDLSYTRGN